MTPVAIFQPIRRKADYEATTPSGRNTHLGDLVAPGGVTANAMVQTHGDLRADSLNLSGFAPNTSA